jgi:hypothetical protein
MNGKFFRNLLDAADLVQVHDSKMLVHQLIALHQVTIEHLLLMPPREGAPTRTKDLHVAAKCQSVLFALKKRLLELYH